MLQTTVILFSDLLSLWTVLAGVQDASFVSSKDRQADALKYVPGWKGGIYEAVQHTDPDSITRSKLADRSAHTSTELK